MYIVAEIFMLFFLSTEWKRCLDWECNPGTFELQGQRLSIKLSRPTTGGHSFTQSIHKPQKMETPINSVRKVTFYL